MPSAARFLRVAAGALALAALTEAGLALAARARPRLTLDIGPATGPYLAGMSPSVDFPPVTARWLRPGARMTVPLDVLPGAGALSMHLVAGPTARSLSPLEVRLAGRPVGRFDVGPTTSRRQARLPGRAPNDPLRDTRLYGLTVATAGGPLTIELDGFPPGDAMGVDWVRIEGLRYRVPWRAWAPRAIGAGLFALALVYGIAWARAFAAGLVGVALITAGVAADPFVVVHLSGKVALPALALSLALAPALRRWTRSPALGFLLLGGFALKGVGVFHPALHAPDALSHNRYVSAFRGARGSFAERGVAAQVAAGVGYPRLIGGRAYAMPYSPVFYLPFVPLPPDRVVGAMKYAVLLVSVAQTAVVFALARGLFGGRRAALVAAWLHTFAAPPLHRLVWAMWPATAGHLADLLALASLLHWMRRPESRGRYGLLVCAVLLSFVTYVSGFVLVGALLAVAALVERRHAGRVALAAAGPALFAVVFVYTPFAATFFRQIVPALGTGGARALGEHAIDPWTSLARVPLFYGWAGPVLAIAGLWAARNRLPAEGARWLRVYGAAFTLALVLRSVGGVMLKDLKDALFVAPLMALLSTAALVYLAGAGRRARWLSAGIVAGLTMQGLALYWTYLTPRLALAAPG